MNGVIIVGCLLCVIVFAQPSSRLRAQPNNWFLELVIEDQQSDSHDHSGVATVQNNTLCCHQMNFDEDFSTHDMLAHVSVPYNHWWRSGATLISIASTLEEQGQRLIEIGDHGLVLDFKTHSRLYVRLQCAFPCCLEAAEIIVPDGAEPLLIVAGNFSTTVKPWEFDRNAQLSPGSIMIGDRYGSQKVVELMWADKLYNNRINALQLCDYTTEGMWIQIDSPSRIVAAMPTVDVCFVDHSMALNWDTNLCNEV